MQVGSTSQLRAYAFLSHMVIPSSLGAALSVGGERWLSALWFSVCSAPPSILLQEYLQFVMIGLLSAGASIFPFPGAGGSSLKPPQFGASNIYGT